MSLEMELGERWPDPVNVEVRVQYASGPPDLEVFCIEPCAAAHAVNVSSPRAGLASAEILPVRWVDLPGRYLYLRCLSVLALHWFGSVDMTPRVRGVPMWRSVGFEMTIASAALQQLTFELQVLDDSSANLRYQFGRDPAPAGCVIELDALDADPLRALLRVGIARVKPAAAPRKAPLPRPSRPSLHVDASRLAAAQRA